MPVMNLIESICKFIENTKDRSESKRGDKIEPQASENAEEKSFFESNPRDGMSLESAKFAIGQCAGNSQYEIHSIENKGRYYTAKIMDSKGEQINELLVDKLTGKVQFLR
jgi:hypothetical protein